MMEVRRYRAGDHDAVWDLHRVEAEYIDTGGEFSVGIIDGRIVAMGALKRLTDTRAEICRMRVHPEFQRRGLGTRMLSNLEERARELGFRTLTLDTTAGQVAAMGMYGHVQEGRVRRGCQRQEVRL